MKLINKAINRGRNIANRDIARHHYTKSELDHKHETADKSMWHGSSWDYSFNLGKAMAYGSKMNENKKLGEIK